MPQDTIVGISTPPGRGGIGVVRLSGTDCRTIGSPFLRLNHPLAHAQSRFGYLLDMSEGQPYPVLDEVVATLYIAPRSYTAEDVLEIASHGSPVILAQVVRQCIAGGARLAEPGEFTRRAFLAGRIDLTQAEAIHDLVESTTLYQAQLAAAQLGGSLSREVGPAKSALVYLISRLEAGIDFADDDLDILPSEEIASKIEDVRGPLSRLEDSFSRGRLVREGLSVVIVGRPNAGKSSLFNSLLERQRAIVTAVPGTTRDLITEQIVIGGVPIELIDTAGIRNDPTYCGIERGPGNDSALEEAELLGIAKTREALAEAGLTLLVIDASVPLAPEDRSILSEHAGRPLLVALNKSDLLLGESLGSDHLDLPAKWALAFEEFGVRTPLEATLKTASCTLQRYVIETSAMTGAGLPELREAITSVLSANTLGREMAMLTNLRQHETVTRTIGGLRDATEALARYVPHEILLLHLQDALRHLDELTGTTTSDDVLEMIFSTFCIGK